MTNETLTEKLKANYLACPSCGGERTGVEVDMSHFPAPAPRTGIAITAKAECSDCGSKWEEFFHFASAYVTDDEGAMDIDQCDEIDNMDIE